jgi:hypothetical protein
LLRQARPFMSQSQCSTDLVPHEPGFRRSGTCPTLNLGPPQGKRRPGYHLGADATETCRHRGGGSLQAHAARQRRTCQCFGSLRVNCLLSATRQGPNNRTRGMQQAVYQRLSQPNALSTGPLIRMLHRKLSLASRLTRLQR